jgi:BASS family bile acid:Na+ symporter
MTLAEAIPLLISLSIFLMVTTLGLKADLRDATYLLRRPGLLLRSVLSMNIVMVVLAAAMVSLFDLSFATKVAIMVIAISPVPPMLPNKQVKSGGDGSYAVGLLVAQIVLAIVLIPITIALLARYFGLPLQMPVARLLPIVVVSVIAPLLLGMVVQRLAPAFAARLVRPLSISATVLLVVAALPVLFKASDAIWHLVGHGGLAVLLAFAVVGVVVGHMLGGPDPRDRTVLALATSARHPGMALTIASLNFPEHKLEVLAVIACHLVISAAVAAYYDFRIRSGGKSLSPT